MAKHTNWVTASEIGTYVYCEEAWRLTHGLKIPPGNVRALRQGTETHAAWQRVERITSWLMRAALIGAGIALALILLRIYGPSWLF